MLAAVTQGACSDVAICCYHRDAARAAGGDQLQVCLPPAPVHLPAELPVIRNQAEQLVRDAPSISRLSQGLVPRFLHIFLQLEVSLLVAPPPAGAVRAAVPSVFTQQRAAATSSRDAEQQESGSVPG